MKKQQKNTLKANLVAQLQAAKLTGKVKQSIIDLAIYGVARTGSSAYSKGWASKSIWTEKVCNAAGKLGVEYERGNDAPRGGASGEYVRMVADKRKNKALHQFHAIRMRALKIKAIRDNRAAELARMQASELELRIRFEAANLIPFAQPFAGEFKAAQLLTGQEKSNTQRDTFVKVLKSAGNPNIDGIFWPVFRQLNAIIIK